MTAMISTAPLTEIRQLVQLVLLGAEANERPDLVRRMQRVADEVAGPAGPAAQSAVTSIIRALESLEVDLRARRAGLNDPGLAARLNAESRHAEARLSRFQERIAGWPRTLNDALAKADSDLEYAVQNRLRDLLEEGQALIESPGRSGDECERWLAERLVSELDRCQGALRAAADVVAAGMSAALELPAQLPPMETALEAAEEVLAHLPRFRRDVAGREPIYTRLVAIIMPAYSGMMVGLVLPKLLGLQLPSWLIVTAAVAGVVCLGGAAFAGEHRRQTSRRHADAVGDLRSVVDAFRLAIGKQVRDASRSIERQLFAAVGEAVTSQTRRLSDVADRIRNETGDDRSGRQALADIDADLESVRDLQLRARRIRSSGSVQQVLARSDGRLGEQA